MKGKGSYRFCLPNVARLRSRVENPSAELTSQIREKLQEIASGVLNQNQLYIKAELINFVVNDLDLPFKTPAYKSQVTDLTNSIFDSVFAPTAEALDALVGTTKEDAGEEATDAPKTAPKAPKAKKSDAPIEEAENAEDADATAKEESDFDD